MNTITENEAARLVSLWQKAKNERAGIRESTRKSTERKCQTLLSLLKTDELLTEATIVKIMNQTQWQYSYRHRLAKILCWTMKWAEENQLVDRSPLFRVRLPRPNFLHRKYWLTREEMDILENMPLIGRLAEIRDFFLIQCYTGLAYADMKRIDRLSILEAAGEKWLCVVRQKTDKRTCARLDDRTIAMLEKYKWKITMPSNQEYNEQLKRIQLAAGIERSLHSHLGCKTFAQHRLEKGISAPTVAAERAIDIRTLTDHYATVNMASMAAEFKLKGF